MIYDPITEENEEEDEEEEDEENDETETNEAMLPVPEGNEMKRCRSPPPPRKSRKRDSAALFDISVGDLPDPDLAGILTEKHSGKEWWCVLVDQHLCIFPSQDPDDIAYDVVILPCCQISLDDRLMRTPVFRLTQSGMTPWVLVAENNAELKEWIHALTTAASGGKYSIASRQDRRGRAIGRTLQGIENIAEEEEEHVEKDEETDHFKMKKTSICEEEIADMRENPSEKETDPCNEEKADIEVTAEVSVEVNLSEELQEEGVLQFEDKEESTSGGEDKVAHPKIGETAEMEEDQANQQFVISAAPFDSKPETPTTLALTDKVTDNQLSANNYCMLILLDSLMLAGMTNTEIHKDITMLKFLNCCILTNKMRIICKNLWGNCPN